MKERIKKPWQAVIITALNLALIIIAALAQRDAQAAKIGENGEQIAALQQELCSRGYYSGDCDGSYCIELRSAVKKFQKDSGIEPSGEADYQTMNALGLNAADESGYFDISLQLLARYIEWKSPSGNAERRLAAGREIIEKSSGLSNPAQAVLCAENEDFCRRVFQIEPSAQSVRAAYKCLN